MASTRTLLAIDTTGLRQAIKALDRVERIEAERELKEVFTDIATNVVLRGRQNARSRIQRRAASTLSNASTSTYGAVKFGSGFGGAFGAEYGAMRNQHRIVNHFGHYTGWNQFQPWKGSGIEAGYFMWPAIRQVTEEKTADLAEAVGRVLTKE